MLVSILDQSPIRAGSAPGEALQDSLALAESVDGLGFTRYWVAEHHALGSVAGSAPEAFIPTIAGRTSQLRVGSGAVLLPNHRPIHVAEQFRTLAALHPGRIDLGIGRSEGALDEAIVAAFARPADSAHGGGYEEQVDQLLAFAEVAPLPDDHPLATVRAAPLGVPLPPVFLLGSSAGSAVTAAERGLGYGFAAYSNPAVAAEAIATYKATFVPRNPGDRPHAILGLKVMVGEDAEHAAALAAPSHLGLVQARLGTGRELLSVQDALAHDWTTEEREMERSKIDVSTDVIGDAETVRAGLEAALERYGADEVIVTMNTPDPAERRAAHARLAALAEL